MLNSYSICDISCANAIHSIFVAGSNIDPFATQIIEDFVDLYVYHDVIHFPVIIQNASCAEDPQKTLPGFLRALMEREQAAIRPILHQIETHVEIADEHLEDALHNFSGYVLNNALTVQQFLALQRESWIKRDQFAKRLACHHVFPMHTVEEHRLFKAIQSKLKVEAESILTVFDIVLRYGIYGSLLRDEEYYMAHPIRAQQNLPTFLKEPTPPPSVPIRLGKYIRPLIKSMTLDEFVELLHRTRGLVRDRQFSVLKKGAAEPEALKELAIEIGLPPRLKSKFRLGETTKSLLEMTTVAGGALISCAASFWKGALPRRANRIKWMHWAFEWDIQNESRKMKAQ